MGEKVENWHFGCLPGNAIKFNDFSSRASECWRVHVTRLAHEKQVSVRQTFSGRHRERFAICLSKKARSRCQPALSGDKP
jgi:hypothetical protein